MLLGDQPRTDAHAEVLVQEAGDLGRGDVAAALEEALGQDGDRIGVRVDELGEDLGEANLVFEGGEGVARAGTPLEPGEQGGEGVLVVVVDLGDVAVGDNYVRQVAQGLDTVSQADGEEGEGKACRGEKGLGRERRTSVSG